MAFDVGSIIGHMILNTDKWDKAVADVQKQTKKLSDKVGDLSKEWMTSGKQLDRLGNKLALIGGIGLAPFALAVKNVSKENFILQNQLDSMGDSFLSMQRTIAANLAPWMEKLTQHVKNLTDGFNQLNPALRQFIVDFVVVISSLTIGAGLILKTAGLLKILGGAFMKAAQAMIVFAAENPFIAIALAVAGLIYLFKNFQGTIGDVWEAIKTTFSYGFQALLQGIAVWILKLSDMFGALISKIPWLPQTMKDANEEIRAEIRKTAEDMMVNFDESVGQIGDAWSKLVGNVKPEIQKIPTVWQEVIAGMQKGIHDLQKEYSNWGEFAKNKTMEIAKSMESIFSQYFFNLMTGQFQSFKETMASLGRAILQMIADIIARMMVALVVKAALAPITGGLSMLIPGFADGTEEVPGPGLYRLHGGEKVTPKYDASGSGNGKTQLTIYNMISPEAVAAAMSSKVGQGVIVNAINADSLRNGVTRREVSHR